MTPPKTALVIGATGGFGSHTALALIKRGWTVRALARDPASAAERMGTRTPIDWVKGDAMDAASVVAAAKGADLIVHAANPPGYRNWKGTVIPMLASTLAAARASGARILFPASVYNFAPDSGANIGETAPQQPVTRKGRLRVRMEAMLREAAERDGVRTLVLRAGDFFGPGPGGQSMDWLTIRRGGRVRAVYAPGPSHVGHAFAYLPDLGETAARLADREAELPAFAAFHFTGHWLGGAQGLAQSVRRVLDQPNLPIRPFPEAVIRLISPFNETLRELLEMLYLWKKPIGLDNARLVAFLGEEPHTALDTAVRATLDDMGVLEEPPVRLFLQPA
ncbi:nucleoside-diphosphate-sugar epimerase [Caulobacter ginsengisoli]|uniref:Nucleoside-diphosphate-sugar epimerase n=1 Tax=Caulobacter ginsengisoli TaxID=400775 RepID=A0ABU0IUG5_9CAUL|nr:NAD-dependent epimerase/dehydratase family protein [Caulobacter ginsengisoli]MDQ0465651.1 nucleoside-diphosphate-sugar epimerase [Caulobacter ginsengisoli]